ncbi:hypothetical protein HDU93_008321 [Gonapodya sp. JEL0774]|nr:hypothetical protein HDU93_008321 [Gonapodya sp. JEL0774]
MNNVEQQKESQKSDAVEPANVEKQADRQVLPDPEPLHVNTPGITISSRTGALSQAKQSARSRRRARLPLNGVVKFSTGTGTISGEPCGEHLDLASLQIPDIVHESILQNSNEFGGIQRKGSSVNPEIHLHEMTKVNGPDDPGSRIMSIRSHHVSEGKHDLHPVGTEAIAYALPDERTTEVAAAGHPLSESNHVSLQTSSPRKVFPSIELLARAEKESRRLAREARWARLRANQEEILWREYQETRKARFPKTFTNSFGLD